MSLTAPIRTIQWFTTAPNPRVAATGHDAGQRGWKLHAMETDADTFSAVKFKAAICGLRPKHGWGLDLFVEDRCKRCVSKLSPSERDFDPEGSK